MSTSSTKGFYHLNFHIQLSDLLELNRQAKSQEGCDAPKLSDLLLFGLDLIHPTMRDYVTRPATIRTPLKSVGLLIEQPVAHRIDTLAASFGVGRSHIAYTAFCLGFSHWRRRHGRG